MQFSKATLNPGEEKISFYKVGGEREREEGGNSDWLQLEIFFTFKSQNNDAQQTCPVKETFSLKPGKSHFISLHQQTLN